MDKTDKILERRKYFREYYLKNRAKYTSGYDKRGRPKNYTPNLKFHYGKYIIHFD